MNEFIKQNRRLLHFYCAATRLLGWLLFVLGGIWGGTYYLRVVSRFGNWVAVQGELNSMPSGIFNFVLAGLVALGVAQFARFLLEIDRQPGWLLVHGEGILYLWAGLIVVSHIWDYAQDPSLHPTSPYLKLLIGLLLALLTTGKVLALVGLAQILRRITPVIEESRTLV
ncbi:MAG: hypothetical protein ACYTEQ_14015 [Planctomycetota bacterium]|jgi:hypothetical protein